MEQIQDSYFLLFLGCIAIGCMMIKSVFMRFSISPIPFLIIFGLITKNFYPSSETVNNQYVNIIHLFGDIGLIIILFQVGVQSNLNDLWRQIKSALTISILEVSISGLFVFLTLFYLLNISFTNSLLIGVAFTATSIAITVSLWEELKALKTKAGQLLLDLSAMDDIAGITLMAIAFGFFQNFSSNNDPFFSLTFYIPIFMIGIKLLGLMLACYAFSVFLEPKLTKFLNKYELIPDPVITIICLVLIFSDIVSYFGLSIALGAFLLGLSFSRDAPAVQMLTSYKTLESFFIPFFFFSVGFSVTELSSIAFYPIMLLLLAAIIGKMVGVFLPSALLKMPLKKSLLLSLSMIPRAEITLFILRYGKSYLNLSPSLYTASIIVILLTCLIPLALKPLIIREVKKDPNLLNS